MKLFQWVKSWWKKESDSAEDGHSEFEDEPQRYENPTSCGHESQAARKERFVSTGLKVDKKEK